MQDRGILLAEKAAYALERFGEARANNGRMFGECGEETRGDLAVQQDEDAAIIGAADEASEGLTQT